MSKIGSHRRPRWSLHITTKVLDVPKLVNQPHQPDIPRLVSDLLGILTRLRENLCRTRMVNPSVDQEFLDALQEDCNVCSDIVWKSKVLTTKILGHIHAFISMFETASRHDLDDSTKKDEIRGDIQNFAGFLKDREEFYHSLNQLQDTFRATMSSAQKYIVHYSRTRQQGENTSLPLSPTNLNSPWRNLLGGLSSAKDSPDVLYKLPDTTFDFPRPSHDLVGILSHIVRDLSSFETLFREVMTTYDVIMAKYHDLGESIGTSPKGADKETLAWLGEVAIALRVYSYTAIDIGDI